MTLLELMLAMTIMVMVIGAMGGLARTVQQGFEYSEGYGIATQHARVVLERIADDVCKATANAKFPGCIVVADLVGSESYPDALVVWRPSGLPANPEGLPLYKELVVYCPNPNNPGQFVEMRAPSDARTVPAADDQAAWRTNLNALKTAQSTNLIELTALLRRCMTLNNGNLSDMRGAARFEVRLCPSESDWAAYNAGTKTWKQLPWPQGIYGTQAGLRQVWVRMELQLMPGVDWVSSDPAAGQPVPFFGSAVLYYNLSHL
jgi:hypothetical protein